MSAAEWKARTGDDAFVDDIATAVKALMDAADNGDTATVADGIAALRGRRDSLRSANAGDEDARDRNEAKIALIGSCIEGLEAISAPDPDGIGAYLDDLADAISWIEAATAAARENAALAEAGAEAEQAAARIAAQLQDLEPGVRRAVLSGTVSPGGLAVVLEKIPTDRIGAIAAEIAAANAANPDYRDVLCGASIARAAATATEPADALAPDNSASALLAAFAAAPAVTAYADQIAATSPTDVRSLAGALENFAVPSSLSRIVAVVHAAIDARFGSAVATDLARGILLLRMIGPSLPAALTAQIETFLGATPTGGDVAVDDALLVFTGHVVAAGAEAAEVAAIGNDPDDIVTMRGNALLGAEELAATFMAPTPPDPLGTQPANPVTVLGQAILKARAARPGGYQWAAVAELQARDIDLFLALIEDERAAVMDLIDIPGGLRDEAAVANAA
jgi:hypothetical protein